MYHDEVDLALRLRAFGFRIVGTTRTAYYNIGGGTTSKLREMQPVFEYFRFRNRLLVVMKYFYSKYLLQALALNAMAVLLRLVRGSNIERRLIIRAIISCMRKLKSTIRIRKLYVPLLKHRKILEKFIMPTTFI